MTISDDHSQENSPTPQLPEDIEQNFPTDCLPSEYNRRHFVRWMLAAPPLMMLAAGQPAQAARTYYVATNGNDANDGSQGRPFATIQRGVELAVPGDTVLVNAGVYRNQAITFPRSGKSGAPITLQVVPGATVIVDGSVPVRNWVRDSGSVYRSDGWRYYFGTWQSDPSDAREKARNQLFVNGSYVREVASRSSMVAGSFYIDAGADRLYLWLSDGGDPNQRTVEATATEQPLLKTNGQDWLVVRGLKFRRCANKPQEAAMVQITDNSAYCILENLEVQYAAGAGLHLEGSRNTIRSCRCNNNGQLGIHADHLYDSLVYGCETSSNNQLPNKQFDPGWEAGGNKFARCERMTVDRHLAHSNRGSGIWFDVSNARITISNCRSYNNEFGIHYEISYTALIFNNLCYGNKVQGSNINAPSGIGIYISSSAGCRIYNNTCCDNDNGGIQISGPVRGDGNDNQVYSYANVSRNNIVASNCRINKYGIHYYCDNLRDASVSTPVVAYSPNSSDYNLFWTSGTPSKFFKSPSCSTLSAWQATGRDSNSRWADPLFVNSGASDYRLRSNSPAIDRGVRLSEVTVDYAGAQRPKGRAYDLGAYESY